MLLEASMRVIYPKDGSPLAFSMVVGGMVELA